MIEAKQWTRDQLSLLLYLECRAADDGGRVSGAHMNADDFEQAREWNDEGFIGFGRIVAKDHDRESGYWVTFSDAACEVVASERKARARRLWEKRTFQTTQEKQAMARGSDPAEFAADDGLAF